MRTAHRSIVSPAVLAGDQPIGLTQALAANVVALLDGLGRIR
ncbi:MAG: hypothetical protein ABFD89_23665 [Bryobacteraceae bacterium]